MGICQRRVVIYKEQKRWRLKNESRVIDRFEGLFRESVCAAVPGVEV